MCRPPTAPKSLEEEGAYTRVFLALAIKLVLEKRRARFHFAFEQSTEGKREPTTDARFDSHGACAVPGSNAAVCHGSSTPL